MLPTHAVQNSIILWPENWLLWSWKTPITTHASHLKDLKGNSPWIPVTFWHWKPSGYMDSWHNSASGHRLLLCDPTKNSLETDYGQVQSFLLYRLGLLLYMFIKNGSTVQQQRTAWGRNAAASLLICTEGWKCQILLLMFISAMFLN